MWVKYRVYDIEGDRTFGNEVLHKFSILDYYYETFKKPLKELKEEVARWLDNQGWKSPRFKLRFVKGYKQYETKI